MIFVFLISICGTLGGLWIALRILPPGFLGANHSERSNHQGAPLQIGGLVMAPVVLALTFASGVENLSPLIPCGLAILAVTGLADDLKELGIAVKLVCQALAAILLLWGTGAQEVDASGFAIWFLLGGGLLLTVYWINVVNFMDGLDWLSIAGLLPGLLTGAYLIHSTGGDSGLVVLLLVSAGSLVGFGVFNTPPARIFLGDCGSLFLGGVSAICLLAVGSLISPVVAVLLFLYHFCDASHTLAVRLLSGERFWEAHSRHAYQLAYRGGKSAGSVSSRVFVLCSALSLLALWASEGSTVARFCALAAGLGLCIFTLWCFRRKSGDLKGRPR